MPGHTNGNQQPSSLFRPGTTSKYVISNTNICFEPQCKNIFIDWDGIINKKDNKIL